MDTLRGFGGDRPDHDPIGYESYDAGCDDGGPTEPPPPMIGQDERRMQVRAYNFWASLLGQGQYPSVASLLAGHYPDFADNAVLLHFDKGIEDPAIAHVGVSLLADCDAQAPLQRLRDVPGRSLLSRITDHYLQIIANEAPIGFEAEFINQRGCTILYRGILLPFSSDTSKLDYILGVINWKELADQQTTDELLLEIGQALDAGRISRGEPRTADAPLGVWADGPAGPERPLDLATCGAPMLAPDAALVPFPAFGHGGGEEDDFVLADWLASARELAQLAHSREDRTRSALYAAIGRAWDFALAAQDAPEDYAEIIADAGLTMQDRAPLTPLVKLVFGADYDKTRLTEYATALAHAQRHGLARGELAPFLAQTPGGLKGVVAIERRLRRDESDKPGRDPRATLTSGLRALPARSMSDLPRDGSEFALVLVRRWPAGDISLLGEVPEDPQLFERAARRLIG